MKRKPEHKSTNSERQKLKHVTTGNPKKISLYGLSPRGFENASMMTEDKRNYRQMDACTFADLQSRPT